jgi:hypothetical protein
MGTFSHLCFNLIWFWLLGTHRISFIRKAVISLLMKAPALPDALWSELGKSQT